MKSPIETAFERLSVEWRDLKDMKLTPNSGAAGFDDLVWEGRAEVKRTTLIRHGIECGERIFFRLASTTL